MHESQMFILLATGFKGVCVLSHLLKSGYAPHCIYSYPQPHDGYGSFEKIKTLAEEYNCELFESKSPELDPDTLAFVVGWQYMLPSDDHRLVILHDSILPRYRGFAPTVNALIKGEDQLGVTALKAASDYDTGDIYAQLSQPVDYPITIEQALQIQSQLSAELIIQLYDQDQAGLLNALPQNESDATYSIWRDRDDYYLDWSRPVKELARTVDALGFPYEGAKTWMNGSTAVITKMSVTENYTFEHRHIGKVFKVERGCPVIIGSDGCLMIEGLEQDGESILPLKRFRTRFY